RKRRSAAPAARMVSKVELRATLSASAVPPQRDHPRSDARRRLRLGKAIGALRQAGLGDVWHRPEQLCHHRRRAARRAGSPGHAARSAVGARFVSADHLPRCARAHPPTDRRASPRPRVAVTRRAAAHPGPELVALAAPLPLPKLLVSTRPSPSSAALLCPSASARGRVLRPAGAKRGNDLKRFHGRLQPPLRAVRALATGMEALALLRARHARVSAPPARRPRQRRR